MARYVFLDSGPLWLAGLANGKPAGESCRAWLRTLEEAGVRVVVPEIADYEVRRELVRRNATAGIIRLDRIISRFPLLLIDRMCMLKAAELWALARNAGVPTADPLALDGDAILAAQVLTAIRDGDVATLATGNVRHLGRFPGIDARPWASVV